MVKFNSLLNFRRIRWMTLIMAISAALLAISIDLSRLLPLMPSDDIEAIRLWEIYRRPWDYNSWLMGISAAISLVSGCIFFIVYQKILWIQKQKEERNVLRQILAQTALYLGIARLIEFVYLFIESDFTTIFEVMGQFYIILDAVSSVLFSLMAFSIFFASDIERNEKHAQYLFILSVFCYLNAFLMMLLYGIDQDLFGDLLIFGFLSIILLSVVCIGVLVKIFRLRQKITQNQRALLYIALMLCLLVLSMFLLAGCGITIMLGTETGLLWNRILRLLRVTCFLIIAISYFPSFIQPAKTSETQE